MTTTLPGFKRQWILASYISPTLEFADGDGEVHVFDGNDGYDYEKIAAVGPSEYWRPVLEKDYRPEFDNPLPPLTGEQPATEPVVEQRYDEILVLLRKFAVSSTATPYWHGAAISNTTETAQFDLVNHLDNIIEDRVLDHRWVKLKVPSCITTGSDVVIG